MSSLRLIAVKKPVPLKMLGLALFSFWQGRVYGADDVVPVEDANKILEHMRWKEQKKDGQVFKS